MFKVGEKVVYTINGVCEFSHVEKRMMGTKEFEYFVLKPVFNTNATVFVPTAQAHLVKRIKPLLSKKEAEALIARLSEAEENWIENDSVRLAENKRIISEGDRFLIGLIIKSSYIHKARQFEKGKKLHLADERLLSEAEKALLEELALVTDNEKEQVLNKILGK